MESIKQENTCSRLLVFVLIVLAQLSASAQSSTKPNIIFILADDLGYGDLGCYGQQKTATPNIDALSKSGMRFTQFYAGTAVCAPSRASLLTGLHTGHTPVRGNRPTKPEGQFPLPESTVTIANLLQKNGYQTAAFGKWGLGFITTTGDPQKKGFDRFYGYNCQTLAHEYFPDHLWSNHDRIDFPENNQGEGAYSADVIHAQAMRFLQEKHNKPFFLYLTYTLPHGDVIAPPKDSLYQKYIKLFDESPLQYKPARGDTGYHRNEPYPHAAFAAMVSRLDAYVGQVVKAVKAQGLEKNTLIIFTSDNGPHREHGGDPAFFNGSGGLRGIKRDLYEGGIRVPFVASWKGKIPAGATNMDPAAFWDIYPTIQQMTGMKTTANVDGISILPRFLNPKVKTANAKRYLYWEFHENGGRQAVRWGNWKGVKLNVTTEASPALELYDLEEDPTEQNNVAAKYPAIVKQLEQYIKVAHVNNPDWPLLKSETK